MSHPPKLSVTIHYQDPSWRNLLPQARRLLPKAARQAFRAAWDKGWQGSSIGHECAIILIDDDAMKKLNHLWRGQKKATDVLSFAMLDAGRPEEKGISWELGDVFLASGVVSKEARQQQKTFAAHVQHLAVHGILHLLGYDHPTRKTAAIMEGLEISAMKNLGLANPYL